MAVKSKGSGSLRVGGPGKLRNRLAGGTLADAMPYSRFSDLTEPVIGGHRGGGEMPEEAYETYLANLTDFAGKPIMLDADLQQLSDGSPCCMHDSTVDRTTTGTGDCSLFTPAQFTALRVDTFDVFNGDYPSFRPCLGEEFLQMTRKIPALLEPKDPASAASVIARIQQLGLQRSILANAFGVADLQPFINAGMPAMIHDPQLTGLTPAQLVAAGVTHINWRATSVPGDTTIYSDAGLKIWSGADRRFDWAPWRTAIPALHRGGISGYPLYIHGSNPIRTTDNFAARRFLQGHHAYSAGFPGRFVSLAGGVGGWSPEPDSNGWCCWGWLNLAKSATPASLWNYSTGLFGTKAVTYPFGIECDLTYVAAGATPTRRAGFALGCTTDGPLHEPLTGATLGLGIIFTIDPAGTMEVHVKTQSATRTASTAGNVASAAIAVGQKFRVRIEKTSSTGVRFTRLDTGTVLTGTASGSSTLTGGYVHAGTPGAAGATGTWAFSGVTVL